MQHAACAYDKKTAADFAFRTQIDPIVMACFSKPLAWES